MNIEQTLQLLDIQEVTTKKQKAKGTREFKLPVKCMRQRLITIAKVSSLKTCRLKYLYKRIKIIGNMM